MSASLSRNAAKRLVKELDTWRSEEPEEKGIERLGPISESDLLTWEAVINGRGVGGGYDSRHPIFHAPATSHEHPPSFHPELADIPTSADGRWLLSITLPDNYPYAPPKMRFITPIVHPNINLDTGEICLDLLKDAWTPAYSVLETVRAVRNGLLPYPEVDSPLNVDAAALLRGGDALGSKRLVELWCSEGRYEGL